MHGNLSFAGHNNFHKLLKDNATNVLNELTNGNYGLLPLIIIPTNWENLYGYECILPNNPGSPSILVAVT